MPNRLDLGVRAFLPELLALPAALGRRAAPIVDDNAEAAADELRQAYPRITGALQDGVGTVAISTDPAVAKRRVVSRAPHAAFYDFGTSRQRPRPTFVPIVSKGERQMIRDVSRMLEDEGLRVRGDVDG